MQFAAVAAPKQINSLVLSSMFKFSLFYFIIVTERTSERLQDLLFPLPISQNIDEAKTTQCTPPWRAVSTTLVNRAGALDGFFPARAAFPVIQAGRRSPLHFRGLLRVHSRYDPPDGSIAPGDLCHEASICSVTQTYCSSASRHTANNLGGTFIYWHLAPSWHTE